MDQTSEPKSRRNPFKRWLSKGLWIIALILCLAIGFLAGTARVFTNGGDVSNQTDQNGGIMISEQKALEIAKARLDKSKIPYQNRQAIVTTRTYKVVFPPPPNTLGGNFTLLIDAETGEVIDIVIER